MMMMMMMNMGVLFDRASVAAKLQLEINVVSNSNTCVMHHASLLLSSPMDFGPQQELPAVQRYKALVEYSR
jgi:hypothetical protein